MEAAKSPEALVSYHETTLRQDPKCLEFIGTGHEIDEGKYTLLGVAS